MRPRDDGFTLVELLVGITITALLGAVVLTSVVRSLQVSAATTQRVDALTTLQQAQERMSRTIRSADPLSAATATTLRLTHYVPIASCAPVGGPDCLRREVVTYTRTADRITRASTTYTNAYGTTVAAAATTDVIDRLDPAAATTFRYFDELGEEWDGVAVRDIRQVQITLQHDIGDAPTLVLSTGVFIRNTRVATQT